MQFFPEFEGLINSANSLSIPIVTSQFIHKCIEGKKIIDHSPYFVFKVRSTVFFEH
jgi:hypothetical protein